MSQSSSERRQHPRLDSNIPLKISSDDIDIVTETHNLSRNGIYCQVNKFIQPMTKIKVLLLLPLKKQKKIVTKKIACEGVVVRSEAIPGKEQFHMAIYFSDIKLRDAESLTEYINTFQFEKGLK